MFFGESNREIWVKKRVKACFMYCLCSFCDLCNFELDFSEIWEQSFSSGCRHCIKVPNHHNLCVLCPCLFLFVLLFRLDIDWSLYLVPLSINLGVETGHRWIEFAQKWDSIHNKIHEAFSKKRWLFYFRWQPYIIWGTRLPKSLRKNWWASKFGWIMLENSARFSRITCCIF